MADCAHTSEAGITASLIDLVDPTLYNGFSGRLYPGNSNSVPAGHNTQAVAAAQAIIRRDSLGNFSPTGKKVFLSCGLSNTTQEFQAFMSIDDPASDVVVVDGAQSARDATEWSDPLSDVWGVVESRLATKGVTTQQVSAIWCKLAVAGVTGTFPTHAEDLQEYLRLFVQEVKSRYPNCKIIFFSSRTYGGYNDTAANPEKYAYESGFSVKWLIESQINATEPTLAYASTPVLLWGPYLWSNGTTPNSEGLSWVCSDFEGDGLHPSATGETKVANKLDTFMNTSTYTGWFRGANNADPLISLNSTTDGSTFTTGSFTIGAYQLAIIFVFSRVASAVPNIATLTGHSLTWAQINTRVFSTEATPRARVTAYWALQGATPSTGTLQASFAGQTQVMCSILGIGFTGVSQAGDVIAQSNVNSADSVTSLSISLLNAPAEESSVIACFGNNLNNNMVEKSGWTEAYDVTTSSPTTAFEAQYNLLFDTPAQCSWGAGTSNAGGIVIEIKAETLPPFVPQVFISRTFLGIAIAM